MIFYYNLERLIQAYLLEEPSLSYAEAEARALELRREFDRLNRNWYNSQLRRQELWGAGSVELD